MPGLCTAIGDRCLRYITALCLLSQVWPHRLCVPWRAAAAAGGGCEGCRVPGGPAGGNGGGCEGCRVPGGPWGLREGPRAAGYQVGLRGLREGLIAAGYQVGLRGLREGLRAAGYQVGPGDCVRG